MKPRGFNHLAGALAALLLCCAIGARAQEPAEPAEPALQPELQTFTEQSPAQLEPQPAPAPVHVPLTVAPSVPPPRVVPAAGPAEIDFEFQNAPVAAVLDWYARLTNRSIIQAPALAGVITFRSQTKLTREEAIQALDSVLAVNGIAALPLGEKFLKVVQIATAKQEGVPFGAPLAPADTLVTQIIPLKFAEAAEVVAALQPYLHAYGQLMALTKSNSILITETAANLNQMLEIIKYVDQPSALRMETKVYLLVNARAADVVQRLQSIIQETQQIGARPAAPAPPTPTPVRRPPTPAPPGAPAPAPAPEEAIVEGRVILTADERTNKIFVLSRPANFAFFDKIIAELDAKVEPDVITRVIALDYANAEDVAGLLNSLITGAAAPTPRRPPTAPGTTPPARAPAAPPPPTAVTTPGVGVEGTGFLQFAEGVRILPDPRTNSLLVMATKEDMERLEQLIRAIDTPVAQVLVEVVIAEVNLDGTLEVGVELVKRLFQEGELIQTGATSTGEPVKPENLAALTGELFRGAITNAAPIALASLSGGLTYFATFKDLKLDAVIRLLSTSSKFKVLSTPIIQTLHNQEANIVVGESRPVVTATVADVVAAGTTAVRSSVEFKDIAIELKVTPRINPDGYVTMEIEQKINDLGGNVLVNAVPVPIITKREAKSSVSVRDQSTIVLGGLIREDKTQSETKVPLLGDIPFFGHLFKGKSQTKKRNELIVFIRPTVLRSDAEAVAEARRRGQMLKAGEELGLDQRLQSEPPAAAVPPQPETGAAESSRKPTASERYAAKVKALQMQAAEAEQP